MKPKVLACELPSLEADTTRQRIQLYPGPGTYVHPAGGEFTLTAETLSELADDVNARGNDIALDYDHSPERGQGSRAAGWFVADTAKVEPDGKVFADVEWTPAAAEAIRNREYRFISPTFKPTGHRNTAGALIPEPKQVGAALTNRPFFATMDPIAADDLALEDSLAVEEAFGTQVADALDSLDEQTARGLIAAAAMKAPKVSFADPGYRKDTKPRYPLTTSEEVSAAWKTVGRSQVAATYETAQLSRIKARIRRAALKFGVTIGADETTKEKTMDLTDAIAADLGVAVDADDETVLAAIAKVTAANKALEAAKPADGTVTLTADEVAELRAGAAQTKTTAAALLENRKTTAIKTAISTGRIAASEEEFYAASFDTNPDGTETFLAAKTPVVPLVPAGHGVKIGDVEVTADLSPVKVDGLEMPVDADRAKVVAATEQLLKSRGKTPDSWTLDEYAAAAIEVAADPALALSL